MGAPRIGWPLTGLFKDDHPTGIAQNVQGPQITMALARSLKLAGDIAAERPFVASGGRPGRMLYAPRPGDIDSIQIILRPTYTARPTQNRQYNQGQLNALDYLRRIGAG